MIIGTVRAAAITITTLPRLRIDCQFSHVANVSGRANENNATTTMNAAIVP